MSAQAKTLNSRVSALWQRLIEPSAAIVDKESRRQARLLTELTLSLGLLATVINLFNSFINPAPNPAITSAMSITILMLVLFVYALARTRLYMHGAALAMGVYTVVVLAEFAVIGASTINMLYYLVMPLALCMLVFSRWLALALLVSITLVTGIIALVRDIPLYLLTANPLSFLFLVTALLYAVRHYLDEREAERRTQLMEREQRYRLVTELITDYAYCFKYADNDWRLDWVSSDFMKLAGYTRDELELHSWRFMVHPDDHHITSTRLAQLEAGQPAASEFRVLTRSGDIRWIYDHAYPQRDPSGQITQIVGASTDITARKNAEHAEREQRLLADALSDAAASIAHSLDLDDVLDRILTNLGRVVPYDAASIMLIENDVAVIVRHQGFNFSDQEAFIAAHRFPLQATPSLREVYERGRVVLIADTASYPGWVRQFVTDWIESWVGAPIRVGDDIIGFLNLDSRTPGHFTAQHADRLQMFADQCSAVIHNARLYRMVRDQAADLEQRVAARTAELEQERRELTAILDSMGEGMCYTEGGSIRYANRALLAMTGFTLAELIDVPLSTFIVDTEHAGAAELDSALRENRVWRDELLLRTRDDKLLETGVTVAPLSASGTVAAGAVAIVRDISLEKTLQRQKNRFISTASHELRTPITNLNTRMYLIQRDPSRMDEHLAIMAEVIDRMRDLSNDLLDLAQLEHGTITLDKQPVRLQELAAAVVRVQQSEAEIKNVTLTLRAPPVPLLVTIDASRITQALTNLVVNAINYTPSGGDVLIETAALDEGWAVVRVRDTGVGISSQYLAQVFEPFFRLQGEAVRGTGLGLSITREVVQLHGGEITVTSEPGQGSCFSVKLRLAGAG